MTQLVKTRRNGQGPGTLVKITQFQVINFMESVEGKMTPRILLYALGEDGIMYEMAGGSWLAIPIDSEKVKKLGEK